MKRLLALLTALVLLAAPALALTPDKPANGYVGDYADVLDASLVEELATRSQALFASTGAEIVVVSVDFMDGMDSESYAKACFDAWGMGDRSRNNGLLLVFAVGENKVWAMPGVGLENALSASTLNDWLEDSFYDPYDAGDYNAAVRGFYSKAYSWLESYYAGGGASGQQADGKRADSSTALGLLAFTAFLVLAVVVIVAVAAWGSRRYSGGYYPRPAPRSSWPLFFLWHSTTHRRRPPPPPGRRRPPSGSSFRSGGSSFHSGGSSFRSGGSSFRSGGGSRGGGAGRR